MPSHERTLLCKSLFTECQTLSLNQAHLMQKSRNVLSSLKLKLSWYDVSPIVFSTVITVWSSLKILFGRHIRRVEDLGRVTKREGGGRGEKPSLSLSCLPTHRFIPRPRPIAHAFNMATLQAGKIVRSFNQSINKLCPY